MKGRIKNRRRRRNRRSREEKERGLWSTWQIASLNRGVNHRGAHTLTQWRAYTQQHKKETTASTTIPLPVPPSPPPPPFSIPNRRRRQSNIRFQSPPTTQPQLYSSSPQHTPPSLSLMFSLYVSFTHTSTYAACLFSTEESCCCSHLPNKFTNKQQITTTTRKQRG